MASLWRAYQRSMSANPLRTKMLTATALWGTIDAITQWFEGKGWSPTRSIRQSVYGCCVHAPWTHVVWNALERLWPAATFRSVAMKVAVDQLISAPAFYFVYFSYIGLAQRESQAEIRHRLDRLMPTMQVVWSLWPFVHFVNFMFVPLHYRLLAALCVQLVFNSYLSHVGNKPLLQPPIAGVSAPPVWKLIHAPHPQKDITGLLCVVM
jgi:hypothetical protein